MKGERMMIFFWKVGKWEKKGRGNGERKKVEGEGEEGGSGR